MSLSLFFKCHILAFLFSAEEGTRGSFESGIKICGRPVVLLFLQTLKNGNFPEEQTALLSAGISQ